MSQVDQLLAERPVDDEKKGEVIVVVVAGNDGDPATEEEYATLRKVAAPVPWVAFALCIVELAERASYYGSSGPFNNFRK